MRRLPFKRAKESTVMGEKWHKSPQRLGSGILYSLCCADKDSSAGVSGSHFVMEDSQKKLKEHEL